MVKLRVAARVIPEHAYLANIESSSNTPIRGERKFPVIIHDPDEWYIGTLAIEIKNRYQSLYKHDLGQIKYLKDNEDDCDLDPEQLVSELLVDEGKAARDGSDQHVTIKVIQEQERIPHETSTNLDLSPAHFQSRSYPRVPRFSSTQSSLGKHTYDLEDHVNGYDGGRSTKRSRLVENQEPQFGNGVVTSIERDRSLDWTQSVDNTQSSTIHARDFGNGQPSPELPRLQNAQPGTKSTPSTSQNTARHIMGRANEHQFDARRMTPQQLPSPARRQQDVIGESDTIPESELDDSQTSSDLRQGKIPPWRSANRTTQEKSSVNQLHNAHTSRGDSITHSQQDRPPESQEVPSVASEDDSNEIYEDAIASSAEFTREMVGKQSEQVSDQRTPREDSAVKLDGRSKAAKARKKLTNADSDKENRPLKSKKATKSALSKERIDQISDSERNKSVEHVSDDGAHPEPQVPKAPKAVVNASPQDPERDVNESIAKSKSSTEPKTPGQPAKKRQTKKAFSSMEDGLAESESQLEGTPQPTKPAPRARKRKVKSDEQVNSDDDSDIDKADTKKAGQRKKASDLDNPGERLSQSLQKSAMKSVTPQKPKKIPKSQNPEPLTEDVAAGNEGTAPQISSKVTSVIPAEVVVSNVVADTAQKPDQMTANTAASAIEKEAVPPPKKRGRPKKSAVKNVEPQPDPSDNTKGLEKTDLNPSQSSEQAKSSTPVIAQASSQNEKASILSEQPQANTDNRSKEAKESEIPIGMTEEEYKLMKSREGMTKEQYEADKKRRIQEAKKLAAEKKKQDSDIKKTNVRGQRDTSQNIENRSKSKTPLPIMPKSQSPVHKPTTEKVSLPEIQQKPMSSVQSKDGQAGDVSKQAELIDSSSDDETSAHSSPKALQPNGEEGLASDSGVDSSRQSATKTKMSASTSSSTSSAASQKSASDASTSSTSSPSPAPAPKAKAPQQVTKPVSQKQASTPTLKPPVAAKSNSNGPLSSKTVPTSASRSVALPPKSVSRTNSLRALHEMLKANDSSGTSTPSQRSRPSTLSHKKSILNPSSSEDETTSDSGSDSESDANANVTTKSKNIATGKSRDHRPDLTIRDQNISEDDSDEDDSD